mgnify:FL=1
MNCLNNQKEEHIGDEFHKATKYDPYNMKAGGLNWSKKPALYKDYPDAKKVPLEEIDEPNLPSFHHVLKVRKSNRRYKDSPLSKYELSYLLWAATGIQRKENGYEFRTAPSAGALYPIETYLVINNVRDIKPGVYHYNIKGHYLELLFVGEHGDLIADAALSQSMCAVASVVYVLTAMFARSKWKYGQRAYRYIYMDAGHIAENLALAATAMDLGACHIGAIYDDEVNKILGIDGEEESAIYLTTVGRIR